MLDLARVDSTQAEARRMLAEARNHKRLSQVHRRKAQRLMQQIAALGIEVEVTKPKEAQSDGSSSKNTYA